MTNDHLNRAVQGLFTNEGLLRRFRRNPEQALSRFGLSQQEVEAVKRGDAEELVGFGLDPSFVWPGSAASTLPVQSWAMRNAKRLVPVALIAAALLAWPSTAHALPRQRYDALRRARRSLRSGVGRSEAPDSIKTIIIEDVARSIGSGGGSDTPPTS